ncbi:cysteine-rich receptor-like protein kinase 29 [Quercus suber]|uniref:Cysteine-rich receptor-like protein kinase 29 n=1 Tax=Quercus suber TaxID=58331 RepID=A0AAW0JPV3_QUESU
MAKVCSRLLFLSSICMFITQATAQPNFLYQFCLNNGNYTSNSTYKANLYHLLSSDTEIDYGFYNSSYGQNPDKVYAIGLCRGDAKPDVCRSCLNNATKLLTQLCPNQKEAIGWYDYCMLRYSLRNIFGIMENSPSFYMWNYNNVSANLDKFNQDLRTLLDGLRVQAVAGGSLRKFAEANATAPNFQTLYALVQCTPDLYQQDCSDCLTGAFGDIPSCCDGKQGGRVVRPSCNFRYEVYRFYDPVADIAPPPSSPPPSLSPPLATSRSSPTQSPIPLVTKRNFSIFKTNSNFITPEKFYDSSVRINLCEQISDSAGNDGNKSQTVIIVVPIIAFVMLIIISFIYLRVRKTGKKPETVVVACTYFKMRCSLNKELITSCSGEAVDEIESLESLQFDFDTVKVATDDFSDANKLGQGGFGVVYKVM